MNSLVLTQPIGNIDAYIQSVRSLPLLSREEEYACAEALQQHQSLQAAQQLVMGNLRFVVKIAQGYKGYGLDLPDLIQEGNIGLMKAVKRFNPSVGVRLISFAVHWIRAEIHEFVIKNWRIAKVATTKQQRKLFFNLRNKKKHLGWLNQAEINSVAKDLGVTPKNVVEMEARMSNYDVAYDPANDDSESSTHAPAAYLSNATPSPEQTVEAQNWENHHNQRLLNALKGLDDRSQHIIQSRWLGDKKATLHELAGELSVSAERVRQLEKKAMTQLKSVLN